MFELPVLASLVASFGYIRYGVHHHVGVGTCHLFGTAYAGSTPLVWQCLCQVLVCTRTAFCLEEE
jgi:hypothetical protein